MRCNGASLMAGGGAVCLNFGTGLMQNIIESFISGGDKLGGVQIHCSPYERVNFRSGFTLSEVQWGGFLLKGTRLSPRYVVNMEYLGNRRTKMEFVFCAWSVYGI